MKFSLSEVGETGLHIETVKSSDWLAGVPEVLDGVEEARITSDIYFDVHVYRLDDELSVRGEISFSLETICSRCLGVVDIDLKPKINLILMQAQAPEDESDWNTNMDYESFTGEDIDLSSYLLEVIVRSLPYKILCKEDCKGLCIGCGENLNVSQCSCESVWVDPRFETLKNLKI